MSELEKAVVAALRVSDGSAEMLLPTIQRLIDVARAELIRSGISASVANDDSNALVCDAIICFCQAKMADLDDGERYMESFKYQQDNLRKSNDE